MYRLLSLFLLLCTQLLGENFNAVSDELSWRGPFTYDNMSIFLYQGEHQDSKLVTLETAMKEKWLTVHETGNVDTLAVENTSQHRILIQSGDIVKGGKQDRVLRTDLIVPPNSGKVSIASFCVEQGRWASRGQEAISNFSSSNNVVSGKLLRYSARNFQGSQGMVWNHVQEEQGKLSENAQLKLGDLSSATSMQLALEDDNVKENTKETKRALADLLISYPETTGFALFVNDEFSRADVYSDRKLFEQFWPKLSEASVIEALADKKKDLKLKGVDKKWVSTLNPSGLPEKLEKRKLNEQTLWSEITLKDLTRYETRDLINEKDIHWSWDKNMPMPSGVPNNQINSLRFNENQTYQIMNQQLEVQQTNRSSINSLWENTRATPSDNSGGIERRGSRRR